MKCALSLAEDNRILSAWSILPGRNYESMPIVDTLPEGDVADYLYVNGNYIYDPLPKPEVEVTVLVTESELAALQEKAAAYDILTEGVTT